MDTFISYDGLPIASGGAHTIGSLSPQEVHESLMRFLDACTNHPQPQIELSLVSSKSNIKLIWQLTKIFGLPTWDMYSVPKQWLWKVRISEIDAAFNALRLSDALTLSFLWRFKFVHANTKRLLDGQDMIPILDERRHNSQIYFRASIKSTVSVWFTLPFSSFAAAAEYFAPFSDLLPFKPSPKHWRVWKCSMNGNWTTRRVEKNIS